MEYTSWYRYMNVCQNNHYRSVLMINDGIFQVHFYQYFMLELYDVEIYCLSVVLPGVSNSCQMI